MEIIVYCRMYVINRWTPMDSEVPSYAFNATPEHQMLHFPIFDPKLIKPQTIDSQRLQNPLIKEYTLNLIRVPVII